MLHDVLVIGGSYAGMAAALQLARARRSVVVVDTAQRRNRFAARSHGFLGQDGSAPADIADHARRQLLAYPGLAWREDEVTAVTVGSGVFGVSLRSGAAHAARRLIVATGIVDALPELPGLPERWGRGVFACPYCDGYELGGAPLGVLATNAFWFHQAMLIPDWGPTTLFANGIAAPDAAQRARLEERGVVVEETPVAALGGDPVAVLLRDGRSIALGGLFLMPRTRFGGSVVAQLGCATEDGPTGSFVVTDHRKETTVPGVFACGDVARAAASVSFAVGDGAAAGIAAHQSLILG